MTGAQKTEPKIWKLKILQISNFGAENLLNLSCIYSNELLWIVSWPVGRLSVISKTNSFKWQLNISPLP
jgi:hypothetical protein